MSSENPEGYQEDQKDHASQIPEMSEEDFKRAYSSDGFGWLGPSRGDETVPNKQELHEVLARWQDINKKEREESFRVQEQNETQWREYWDGTTFTSEEILPAGNENITDHEKFETFSSTNKEAREKGPVESGKHEVYDEPHSLGGMVASELYYHENVERGKYSKGRYYHTSTNSVETQKDAESEKVFCRTLELPFSYKRTIQISLLSEMKEDGSGEDPNSLRGIVLSAPEHEHNIYMLAQKVEASRQEYAYLRSKGDGLGDDERRFVINFYQYISDVEETIQEKTGYSLGIRQYLDTHFAGLTPPEERRPFEQPPTRYLEASVAKPLHKGGIGDTIIKEKKE